MFIKQIVIKGSGGEVEIARLAPGAALVTSGDRVLCEFTTRDGTDVRFAKAYEAAKVVYGTDSKGRANGTNSMVREVLHEIERVAGC